MRFSEGLQLSSMVTTRINRHRGQGKNAQELKNGQKSPSFDGSGDQQPLFYYSIITTQSKENAIAVVFDSGACAPIDGKKTLEITMHQHGLTRHEDTEMRQCEHKFGNASTVYNTIAAERVRFVYTTFDGNDHIEFTSGLTSSKATCPFFLVYHLFKR